MKREEIIINGEKYIKLSGIITKLSTNTIYSEVVVKAENEHEYTEVSSK